jgi:putative addiction module killer protein
MTTVRYYRGVSGRHPFRDWLTELADRRARAAVLRRIDRLVDGNFGETRFLRNGVSELKIDIGPGYRVYYAQVARTVVLLLCAGSKRTQRSDIARAVEYWNDFQSRS